MTERHSSWSVQGPALLGGATLVFLVLALGVWSATSRISGAVIATGSVAVQSNRQVVQHAEGGIVGELLIRDGTFVAEGETLLRLDSRVIDAELNAIDRQILESAVRRARLTSELTGADSVSFPDALVALVSDTPELREQLEGQVRLFAARRAAQAGEVEQLGERIVQARNRIIGIEAQLASLNGQSALIGEELSDNESLLERGLVQRATVAQLRRQALQIAGGIGKLLADIAEQKGEIAAFEIEKLRLTAARREEVIVTLRDLTLREIELEKQKATLEARRARMDIRAPVAGIVHGMTVFNAGAVVRRAEPLMYVVPQSQPLVVMAQVNAKDVDDVFVGQEVTLRFPTFNARSTPEIIGTALTISADAFTEEGTGRRYYSVEIVPADSALADLGEAVLVPGMPVEAFLRTSDRTPLSYLAKPLTDYFTRAMRES